MVDDSAASCFVLAAHLDAIGVACRTTLDPHEALAWLRGGERFGAIVLDAAIAGVDCVEVVRRIREVPGNASVPLVLLGTLRHAVALSDECADESRTTVLVKPVKPSRLLQLLAGMSNGAQARRDSEPAAPKPEAGMAERLPLRILIAEDNRINQRVALKLLERIGYRADVAANGVEVLARARAPGLRRRAHGRADAGDGRARGDARDPRAGGRARRRRASSR